MDSVTTALMRLYLDDPNGPKDDPFFSNETLALLFSQTDEDLNAAVASGWRAKAANVHDWYQANIDGAFLSRDQVFRHCMQMAEIYEKKSSAVLVNVQMTSANKVEDVSSEFS